jgi:hypothetical protein
MRNVLESIKRSVDENPRTVTIVYYNAAVFGPLLQNVTWLKHVRELKTCMFVHRYSPSSWPGFALVRSWP